MAVISSLNGRRVFLMGIALSLLVAQIHAGQEQNQK
jgi:hypothetical protein